MDVNLEIDKFLDSRIRAFSMTSPNTFWPANGAQLYSYFSDEEALDILKLIKKIKKDKIPISKITELFYAPTTIRYYLGNAVRGLKTRKKYYKDISDEEILVFMNFFFEILKNMQSGDIFCSDGKNEILNKEELNKLISEFRWNNPDEKLKTAIAKLIINSSNMVWTNYYDCMAGNGLENHGPYDVSEKFGKDSILIIREFFNLNPVELWEHAKNFKYNNIKIYSVYKNLGNVTINYFSHIVSNSSFREKLINFYVLVDGKEVKDLDKIEKIIEQLISQIEIQKNFVNSLNTEEKIKKAAESSYYGFKKFREFLGENWKPKGIVEKALNEFGLKFWNEFKGMKNVSNGDSLIHLKQFLDPRNNLFD